MPSYVLCFPGWEKNAKGNDRGEKVQKWGNTRHWRVRYEAMKTEQIMRAKTNDVSAAQDDRCTFESSSIVPTL